MFRFEGPDILAKRMVFNDKWEMLILSADDMKAGSSTLYFIDLKKNGSLIKLHPFSGKRRAM